MKSFLHRIFGNLLTFKTKPQKFRTTFLNREKSVLVNRQLSVLMEEKQPFLIENYSLKDLADELDMHPYQLSSFLNREIGMNFHNYLNQFRVKHCKKLIEQGATQQLNLKGLASKCGFHNRNTFTSAFKKFTNYTPIEYIKRFHNYNYYNN